MVMSKLITMILVMAITGCFYSVDVTNDPDFYYGYRKGQVYEIRTDLYIIYSWDNYLLVPGKHSPTIAKYFKNPQKYSDIKGVLKEKSMVRVEKLSYRETFEASYLDIHAKILDGEYKDEFVILNLISKTKVKPDPKGGYMREPNPAVLKLIKNE